MKILILTRHFHPMDRPSGVVSLIREFIFSFLKQGHEVRIACIKNKGESEFYIDDAGLQIYKFNKLWPVELRNIKKQFSPDKVIIFSSISGGTIILAWWLVVSLIAGTLKKTFFYQTTNLELSKNEKTLFRKLLKAFDLVLCTNKSIVDEIGLSRFACSVVVPGTDIKALHLFNKASITGKHDFSVCFMGHLSYVKGADIVVDLAERLPYIHFKMVAGHSPGNSNIKFYSDLTQRIQKIKNVEHHKFTNEPIPILSSCKLLILPYRSGVTVLGVAQSAIEAMALGIPVISSKNSAINEILIDGYNGYYANSIDEIEDKILCLKGNSSSYNDLSKNAKHTVESSFNIHRQAIRILQIEKNHA